MIRQTILRTLPVAGALLKKETRECVPAAIGAAVVFVGVPMALTLVYALNEQTYAEQKHEVLPGFFAATLLLAGWLFSAVLAAQGVCRDWGHPQGRFLLSRPISPVFTMMVKTIVSLVIVIAIGAAVGALEALLLTIRGDVGVRGAVVLRVVVVATGMCVTTFSIALGTAAITRQELSSIMVAATVFALVLLGPLVTTRLSWQDLGAASWDAKLVSGSATLGWWSIAVCALGLGGFTALMACRYQAGIRLGTKTLAWTIALAMVAPFAAATQEIGANVPVSSIYWLTKTDGQECGRVAIGQNRLATLCWRSVGMGRSADHKIAVFELDAAGRVGKPTLIPVRETGYSNQPMFDDNGQLYLVTIRIPAYDPQLRRRTEVSERDKVQLELRRVYWNPPGIGPAVEVQIPDVVAVHSESRILGVVIDEGELLVLLGARSTGRIHDPYTIYVATYRIRNMTKLTPERVHGLGKQPATRPLRAMRHAADGQIYASYKGWNWLVEPGVGEDGTSTAPRLFSRGAPETPDSYLILDGQYAMRSDRSGIQVLRSLYDLQTPGVTREGDTERAALVRASPWEWLFRSTQPALVAAGDGRVWEIHDARATCYDTSDRTRPRPVGRVCSYPIHCGTAARDLLVLHHVVGFSVVKLPSQVESADD